MNSIRVRVLLALLAMLVVTAAVLGALTYRNVLAETEALFDYQLRQMAFSLRDQGEIAPAQVGTEPRHALPSGGRRPTSNVRLLGRCRSERRPACKPAGRPRYAADEGWS